MWCDVTNPFPNFNGANVEIWEWINNFISQFTGHVITYPCYSYVIANEKAIAVVVHYEMPLEVCQSRWHCLVELFRQLALRKENIARWNMTAEIILGLANERRRYIVMSPLFGWAHTKNNPWWRHQMETFSALLAICAGNSPVPGEFPAQRPVTRSFDVFFDLRLNKRLSKQSWGWWFETPSCPLWRHSNAMDWRDMTHHTAIAQQFPKGAGSSSLIVAKWRHMAPYNWINIDSGNGLLPGGIKPLHEPMMNFRYWVSVVYIGKQFHGESSEYPMFIHYRQKIWNIFYFCDFFLFVGYAGVSVHEIHSF